MTTTKLKKVLFSALCLVTSLSASAQYTVDIKAPYRNNYANTAQSFKLTELATALGTDTASLIPALDRTDSTHVFTLVKADGSYDNTYTGNTGEYWLSYNGESKSYGQGSWFIGFSKVDSADVFNLYAGNFPDSLKDGGTMHATAALVYGEKAVTFDITFEVAGIPKAETDLSKLTVVGKSSVTIHQQPKTSYDSEPAVAVVEGLAEKLGTDNQTLSDNFANLAYMKPVDATYGILTDTAALVPASTNGGWVKQALDAASGDTLLVCGNYRFGSDDAFYIDTYTFTNDTISANIGQYPSVREAGDSLNADVYYIVNDKAYIVNYTLVIDAPEFHGLADMTQVGDTTIEIHQTVNTDYSTVTVTIDPQVIADALGTTVSNLSFQGYVMNGEERSLSSNTTANNGGYWMTKEGAITAWGSTAVWFMEPVTSKQYDQYHVGQYPNNTHGGDTCTTTLYFVNGAKYYALNITLYVDTAKTISSFNSVATKNLVIQAQPSQFSWSANSGFAMSEVNTLIGTTDPVLYGTLTDSLYNQKVNNGEKLTTKYTKEYTVSETPGFWCDSVGLVANWGLTTDNSVAVSCQDNTTDSVKFKMMQKSPFAVGTVVPVTYYLVNEETGDMITVNISYQIVAELDTFKTVGSSTQTLVLDADAYDNDAVTAVDFKPIADALGVDVKTLLQNAHGQLANGTYSEAIDMTSEATLAFDANGYYDSQANALDVVLVDNGDGTYSLSYYSNAFETGTTVNYNAVVMFQNGGSRYFLTLNLVDPASYATGINGINAAKSVNGRIYDLSGRQISTPVKGQVYIQNGKKYVK